MSDRLPKSKTRETWRRKVMGLKSGFCKKFLLTMIARPPKSAEVSCRGQNNSFTAGVFNHQAAFR
jgi:hypothetical protein